MKDQSAFRMHDSGPLQFAVGPRVEGCHDMRCLCGSLLARLVEGGVELKCRRCKRAVIIPISPPDQYDAE